MINSMYKKLLILFAISFLLTILIMGSMIKIYREQEVTGNELRHLTEIQLGIDLLRSQLWFFSQRGDTESFRQVEIAQQELSHVLQPGKAHNLQLANLIKMNDSLANLLKQEMRLKKLDTSPDKPQGAISSSGLLHARYNMLIQSMSEEIAYVHKTIVNNNEAETRVMLYYTSIVLILSSVMLSSIALSILRRFRRGSQIFQNAIYHLSQGVLGRQIIYDNLDTEFVDLAKFFNRMTSSLRMSMVTKKELETEVTRQTAELEKQKNQLEFLSEHDSLTNLLNRRALENAIDRAISRADRTGTKIALLFIDLDNFKPINDEKGHDAGDLVLKSIARRLEESVRETDQVGRQGGDEFLVCLDLLDSFDIVAHKAQQLIDELEKPIIFAGEELYIGVSIGVSYFPGQAENRNELIHKADMAMYQAKELSESVCFDGETVLAKSKNAKAFGCEI
ncbi:GGDEF domain-containing protein [Vibrio albus]|nr:GGDEF domain-containing protein [Vibrio albus]